MVSEAQSPVRIDAWAWAVRLFPTRAAAAEACRSGHVKLNGINVKPAHAVRIGDTVRTRTTAGERIVIVKALIRRRVGAAVAVDQYEDRTPVAAESDVVAVRERGAGRPTKRDRRELERLRGR